MNKKCMAKIGAISLAAALTIALIFFVSIFLVSATKDKYIQGEKVKIEIGEIGEYFIKIKSPVHISIKQSTSPYFIYQPSEIGDYEIQIESKEIKKTIKFQVVEKLKETPKEHIEKKKTIINNNTKNEVVSQSQKPKNQICVGFPVNWTKKIQPGKHVQIKIPESSTNISINSTSIDFKVKKSITDSISNIISKNPQKSLLIQDSHEALEVSYQTPAPEKKEKTISNSKKEVEVSSKMHYENVIASTKITKEIPLNEKESIRIFWKEENIYLPFEALDTNNNSLLDTVKWTIPHLSTQTFEIIIITKAEHLSQNRTVISDIYEEVRKRDQNWITIPSGNFVRIVFEKFLTSKNDITIYAKSNETCQIEVYEKDSDSKIAQFPTIKEDKKYQIFLTNLTKKQNTFDLKITNGNCDIDYITDPISQSYNNTINALNPEARWILDSNGNDYSGNGHNPDNTVGSPTFGPSIIPNGPANNSMIIDSSEGYNYQDSTAINTYANPAGDYWAISLWFNASSVASNNGNIIYEEGGGVNSLSVYTYNDAGTRKVYCTAVEGANEDWTESAISIGEVYHLGCIWDIANGNIFMYINGTLVDTDSSLSIGNRLSRHTGDIAIAEPDADPDNHLGRAMTASFQGQIADIALWGVNSDGAVSGENFTTIHNLGRGINYIPTHTTPILNSTSGTNSTIENLTCYNQSTSDLNGDTVINIINWQKNGTSLTSLNLPFEENNSLRDFSGNHTLTSTASHHKNGSHDESGYYSFNGSTSLTINSDMAPIFGKTGTVMFWIKTSQTGSNTVWQAPGIFGVEQAGGNNDIFWGHINSAGHIGITAGDGSTAYSSIAINNNTWYHIAMTRNSSSGRVEMYLNGKLDSNTNSDTGDKTSTFDEIGVLEDTGGSPVYFIGDLDDFLAYPFILSPEQIAENYKGNYSLLLSQETEVGDSFTCNITPTDRRSVGKTLQSNSLLVKGHTSIPLINITRIWPTSDNVFVEQNQFFNVTLNVTCYQGDCGTINVTLDPIQETYNDFETGTEGFEHFALNAKADEWHITTESTHNGSQAWKCGDNSTGTYSIYSDSILVTPTYDITANSTFSFYHYMYTETGYDGGYLEYKINGTSWNKFTNFISGGYTGTYRQYNGGPPLTQGEAIWTATIGSSASFTKVVLNMSEIRGDNVTFRFHFFADDSIVREGWYIDSVNFTTQTPSMDKGIIPIGSGTPFYTNATSNPITTSSLSENQSELITFFVNATGKLDSKYFFFAYANLTSNITTGDRTKNWNVTISVQQELPNITIIYPTSGTINDATPILNINLTSEAKTLWYNINGGANKTLCTNCNGSNDEVLFLRESDYIINVFATNPMGETRSKSTSFNVDMNNNYFDTYLDSSHITSSENLELLKGNITLDLSIKTIIDERFTDADNWVLSGGRWEINSEELRQTMDRDDTLAVYNNLELNNITNYNVSFRMYSTDNDRSGFLFGYEDSTNYYRCQVRQQSPIDAEIIKVSGGSQTTISTTSDSATYNLNSWNDFLLEIKGSTISCYVNGNLATQATGVNLSEGKVGIYNDNNINTRYDNFTTKITGGKKSGTLTSYSIDLIDTITKFTNITWNDFTNNNNNSIKIELSADDGTHWYEATKNSGLSTITTGDKFIYRIFFDVENLSIISLLDLNVSWSNTVEPPPTIYVEGINTPTEQDYTPLINVTLGGTASVLTMSKNGVNQTICTSCSGSRLIPLVLEEKAYTIIFYANNTAGTTSQNSTSFTVDYNKHYYDEFLDNYSIKKFNNVFWTNGSLNFTATSSTNYNGRSCDDVWGFNCGTDPDSDNTFDSCANTNGGDEHISKMWLNSTTIKSGDSIQVTCQINPSYGPDDEIIAYRNSSTGTWRQIARWTSAWSANTNYSYSFVPDAVDGEHQVRCAVQYAASTTSDTCLTGGGYYDNDDMNFNVTSGSSGSATSYTMNTSQEVTSISHISWTETGTSANNEIKVELSFDNGNNWNQTTNGGTLTGFTPGLNLIYRILFSAQSVVNMSIKDLNFTWESPPTIEILYPETYTYNAQVTSMNYTVTVANGATLDTCWYTLNGGTTNTTITCGENITGITSSDGSNTWTIYANDSDGMLGKKSVTFSVDTSAPVITFINQTGEDGRIINDTNHLFDTENLTINLNITDSAIAKVWIVIWEGVIGGVEKARYFLTNIFGDLWKAEVPTDESYGGDYNYTIYANDTTGLETNQSGNFSVLNLAISLGLNPGVSVGNENISMTGNLNFSNGTKIGNNAINFWLDDMLIPFENLTKGASSLDVLNFTEDEIKILSNYKNITYSNGNFSLDGTNTSGTFTGILDAGALVNWDKVSWNMMSQSCSGSIDVQNGDTNSYSGTSDSYISTSSQNTNYGAESDLMVDSGDKSSLVKFTNILGFGKNKIPYGSTITSATLRLTVFNAGTNPNFHEILEEWDEDEVTYNYRTNSDLWGSQGMAGSPSINTTILGTMSTSSTGTKTLSVTGTVGRWVSRTIKNNGFAIHPLAAGDVGFRSSEYSTSSDRPRLSVDFTSADCTGIQLYIRTSRDKTTWSPWTEIQNNQNITDTLNLSRYLEYKVEMGSYNSSFKAQLLDLNFNYTGTFTNQDGFFNYSFLSTDVFGTYNVNVTSGYRTMKANAMTVLAIQSGLPPEVKLLAPENETWHNIQTLNLTYNATDLNGDFKSSTLILDGATNQTNQTQITSGSNNFTITGLTEGAHTWSVNLSDTTITNSSETWTIYIDLTNPEITLINPPNESSYTLSELNLTFRATDNMDNSMSCNATLDNNIIQTGITAPNNTATNISSGTLTGGNHFWNITCQDQAGNTFTSETREFTITDTPPIVNLISPNDNHLNSNGNLTLRYNVTDNSGINKCELLINGVLNQTNNSVTNNADNFFNITEFADGKYNWTVKCYDLSNTSNTPTNRSFNVDLNDPIVNLISPTNQTTSQSSTVNFTFNVTDTIDQELNCSLYIDNINELDFLANAGQSTSQSLSNLDDGPKYWKIDCLDDSGHTGQSEIRMVNITEHPTIEANNTNSTHHTGNSFIVYFIPHDNTQINSCSVYLNGIINSTQSSITNNAQNNIELENLADGRYTYYTECTDGIGLKNQTQEQEFFIDNDKPTIQIHFPKNEGVFAQNISFEFKAIDTLSQILTCNITIDNNIEDQDFTTQNNTNTTRTISGITDGNHFWNITCQDQAGNINISETYNFTKYTSPGITLISPSNNIWLNTGIFNFTYIPKDDEGFQVSKLILNKTLYMENQTAIINNVQNNFSVNLQDGIYNWTINLTDSTGMLGVSEERRVYIDTHSPSLELIFPSQNEVVDNNNVTFTFNVTDNIDDSTSCNLSINGEVEFTGNMSNGTNIVGILLTDGNKTWDVKCWDDAGNTNTSQTINFTVFAPPKINLEEPINNFITRNSTINFSYTPIDALGITNCSLYINDILNQTDSLIEKNVINNFILSGVSEGFHNWSVECTDNPEHNINRSNYRNFSRDLTPPTIQLNHPENNIGINANNVQVSFNWTPSDIIATKTQTLLVCNLTVDGTQRYTGYKSSGYSTIEQVSGLAAGQHFWNVSCKDQAGNWNTSETYSFNMTYPDLQINQTQIFFSPEKPIEGESTTLTATIHNLASVEATSVQVEFYNGDPDTTGTQIGSTQTISVSSNNQTNASVIWSGIIGMTRIFVKVDPSNTIVENDETNNKATRNITVPSWHLFYGEITPDTEFKLADSMESKIIQWNETDLINSNIYVADRDSSIEWTSLQAIGKDTSNQNSSNDIKEIDTILGSTTFSDSIESLYLNAGQINETQDIRVFNKQINNIPVAISINSSNFKTGILWDTSDDSNGEFNIAEKEDIVFITHVNKDTQGSYGIVDYELRVPALLRNYNPSDQTTAAFYLEIN